MGANWSFLTNHGRVLLRIAHDPNARLRDIAATLSITERSASGIVSDLTDAGYVLKSEMGAATDTSCSTIFRFQRQRFVSERSAKSSNSSSDRNRTTVALGPRPRHLSCAAP